MGNLCSPLFSSVGAPVEQSVLSDMEARRGRLSRQLAERGREARKAGGAVYTPPRVVDYLVERTLGRLLEGKTPRDAARVRILDPACGAGAFLLAAYRLLLDWHLHYYAANNPHRWGIADPPAIVRVRSNRKSQIENRKCQWRLTFAERQRILLNSIFGVDIDPAAVELARLSLHLVMLDSRENKDGIEDGALSGMARNVRCGDALIGPDFARGRGFDWRAEFPDAFSGECPGFDIVLGNPPYLSYSGREAARLDPAVRKYFARTYETAGWPTAHGLFIERAIGLLSRRIVAFIVPDQVGHLAGYRAVRALVARRSRLAEVRYWGEDVFPGVVTPALTFVADTEHTGGAILVPPEGSDIFGRPGRGPTGNPLENASTASGGPAPLGRQPVATGVSPWNPGAENAQSPQGTAERARAHVSCRPLRGLRVGPTASHGLTPVAIRRTADRPSGSGSQSGHAPSPARDDAAEALPACPVIPASALASGAPWIVSRHHGLIEKLRERSFSLGDLVADPGVHTGNCARKLIFPLDLPPEGFAPSGGCLDSSASEGFTLSRGVVPILEGKRVSRYQCLAPAKSLRLDHAPEPGEYFTIRPEARYASAPFLIRQTAAYPIVGPRRGATYFRNSLLALYPPKDGHDVRYLVALLNSSLLRFVYAELVPESRQRAFPQVKVSSLRQLPIRSIDFSDPADAAAHTRLVELVDRMVALHQDAVSSGTARAGLESELVAADREIDALVNRLYALTESEIAIAFSFSSLRSAWGR